MFQYILKQFRCCRLRRGIGVGERPSAGRCGGVSDAAQDDDGHVVALGRAGAELGDFASIAAMVSRSILRPGLGLRRTIGRVGSACGFTPAAIGAVEDVRPVSFPLLSPLEGAFADGAVLFLARGVVSAFHGAGVCGSRARHGLVDWRGADSFDWTISATAGSTGRSSNSSMGSTGVWEAGGWASEPPASGGREARDIMRCWV